MTNTSNGGTNVFVQIAGLSKSYGGVHAIQNISLDIFRGEIHALCGENGAGKSTFIKCLTGVERAESGEVTIEHAALSLGDVAAAEACGIAVIHQESTTFPDLNTVDNIFVGRELRRFRGWILDRATMKAEARSILKRLNQTFAIDVPLGQLTVAERQMVAMARALSRKCRLLIMDEPTASLSSNETRILLDLVNQLRDQGVAILYVSHRLEEVFEIADRVTVLRDGQHVATREVHEINRETLIRLMVGREVKTVSRAKPKTLTNPNEPNGPKALRLRVTNLTRHPGLRDISFSIREGEIVGLAGLVGAGRSEVARAIFGVDAYDSGSVFVDGQSLAQNQVQSAIAAGLALVPEDRQHEGLVLPMPVATNVSLAVLRSLTRWGFINRRKERELVDGFIRDLSIRAESQRVPANTLSGGNQQKLVIGKWLASSPRVLLLDEPTRGVDVGAKAQVHELIQNLAKQGMATLVISSELAEILAICDRVLVMSEGQITADLVGCETSQEEILRFALPQNEHRASNV